jgi:hypothetical protein
MSPYATADLDALMAAIRAELPVLRRMGAKGVSPEKRERFPDIHWKAVAGMKDIATHQYHGIMLELVWETASVRVPELLRSLERAG